MTNQLRALGESAERNRDLYKYEEPDLSVLEWFDNPTPDLTLSVQLVVSEFTSCCPRTGQPDYGELLITYTPNKRIIESKSLKLYLMQFRQYGCFGEGIVTKIRDDLIDVLDPVRLEVRGEFAPRGGIAVQAVALSPK